MNLPKFLSNAKLTLSSDIYAEESDGPVKKRKWKVPEGLKTITWREQHKDPIFKFVELVSGAANVSIWEFMYDDADEENNLSQLLILENYARFLEEKRSESQELSAWRLIQIGVRNTSAERNHLTQSSYEIEIHTLDDLRAIVQNRLQRGNTAPYTVFCGLTEQDMLTNYRDQMISQLRAVNNDIEILKIVTEIIRMRMPERDFFISIGLIKINSV